VNLALPSLYGESLEITITVPNNLFFRFGQHPSSGDNSKEEDVKVGSENVIKPRLLLYPEHNLNHSQVNRFLTLNIIFKKPLSINCTIVSPVVNLSIVSRFKWQVF